MVYASCDLTGATLISVRADGKRGEGAGDYNPLLLKTVEYSVGGDVFSVLPSAPPVRAY